jgi:5-formyltetrahydrofolate cyclo-ligase
MINKGDLRAKIKMLFEDITPEEKTLKSKNLFKNLDKFLQQLASQDSTIPEDFLIGVFAPMHDEAQWMFNHDEYSNLTAFPTVENGFMTFKKSAYGDLEESRDFGVVMKSPKKDAKTVNPHALVIPGRAFTKNGERLGRGKGYYDKYLASYSGKKIGLCFEEQILDEIPTEKHDINMDIIITDKNIYGELTP